MGSVNTSPSDAGHVVSVCLDGIDVALAERIAEIAERRDGEPIGIADLDELREAYRYGRYAMEDKASAIADRSEFGLVPKSLLVGNVTLHSPTIAYMLYAERLDTWIPPANEIDPGAWVNIMVAFGLAHAYDEETMRLCQTQWQAEVLAKEWALGLTCTLEQLREAVQELRKDIYPEPAFDSEQEEQHKVAQSQRVSWSKIMHGAQQYMPSATNAEMLYGVPVSNIMWRADAANHAAEREHREADPKAAPGPDDPRVKASARWHRIEQKLLRNANDGKR